MPIWNGPDAGGGDEQKLPVVRRGENLQTWLRRAVPALVAAGMADDEAANAAREAWNRVNGGKFAGEEKAPAGETPKADAGDTPQDEPAATPKGDTEEDPKAPQPKGEPKPQADPKPSQPMEQPQDAQPDAPQPPMDWDKQSTWQGEVEGGTDAPADDTDSADDPDPMPEDTLAEWFANQMFGFADALAAQLVANGSCDEEQAAELVQAASSLSDGLHASLAERLAPAEAGGFSFAVDLPDPAQFGAGKAYYAPHYGRTGQRGGSAPRQAGKERVDTPEFRRKVDEADNKLYDEVIGAFQKGQETGFSYQPVLEKAPTNGYALSPYPERSKVFDVKGLTVESIAQYMIDNAEMWGDKNHYLGGWLDQETGKFYLDVSVVVQTPAEAEKLTRRYKERAYFDIAKGETVFVTSIEEHEGRALDKSLYADELHTEEFTAPASGLVTVRGDGPLRVSVGGGITIPKTENFGLSSNGSVSVKGYTLGFNSEGVSASGCVAHVGSGLVCAPQPDAPSPRRPSERPTDDLAIKALRPNRVGAYLCLWGSPAVKDLSGEWFAPDTEELTSIFKAVGVLPAIYHHAIDSGIKSTVIGLVDVMEPDDTGLWIEAQIKEHEAYQRLIEPLVRKGMLGWSSGALPGARRVNKATGKITRWPIVEASMTPTPMEWRMAAQYPIQHIKGIYRLAGLPVRAVENLTPAGEEASTALEREMELIRLLELSNNEF